MGAKLVAVWPKVSTHIGGEDVVTLKGHELPDGIRLFDKQVLVLVGAAAYVGGDEPTEIAVEASETPLPLKSAVKADWAAYAIAQGADPAIVAGMTKTDLVALYVPAPPEGQHVEDPDEE